MKVSYRSNIVSSTLDLPAELEKLEKMNESSKRTSTDCNHLFKY